MANPPKSSPWGLIQYCEQVREGIFVVTTASHGGTMVANDVADKVLSPAARKCGFVSGGHLCFEEDCQASVVIRELLDKKLWEIPPRVKDKAKFVKSVNESIQRWNPDYWKGRAQSRQNKSIKAQLKGTANELKNRPEDNTKKSERGNEMR